MANEQAVRGHSITAIENNIPSPPVFDFVPFKTISKTSDYPVFPTPVQPDASIDTALPKSVAHSIVKSPSLSEERKIWPCPEKCIGRSFGQVGNSDLQCWEAIGPARELTQGLCVNVATLLECKADDIFKGKSVRADLMFGIYMIGKSSADARPCLVVSGQEKPRKRAVKVIRKSKVLDDFKEKGGIGLRDHKRLLISKGPVTLISGTLDRDMPTGDNTKVFYDPHRVDLDSTFQLYIPVQNEHGILCRHKATLGLFLWFRGQYYAFTAAHPFLDLPSSTESEEESDADFSFEDESDISSCDWDENVSETTGKGTQIPNPCSARTRTDHRFTASFPAAPSKTIHHVGPTTTNMPESSDELWGEFQKAIHA
jgi:hypothetical protein